MWSGSIRVQNYNFISLLLLFICIQLVFDERIIFVEDDFHVHYFLTDLLLAHLHLQEVVQINESQYHPIQGYT